MAAIRLACDSPPKAGGRWPSSRSRRRRRCRSVIDGRALRAVGRHVGNGADGRPLAGQRQSPSWRWRHCRRTSPGAASLARPKSSTFTPTARQHDVAGFGPRWTMTGAMRRRRERRPVASRCGGSRRAATALSAPDRGGGVTRRGGRGVRGAGRAEPADERGSAETGVRRASPLPGTSMTRNARPSSMPTS